MSVSTQSTVCKAHGTANPSTTADLGPHYRDAAGRHCSKRKPGKRAATASSWPLPECATQMHSFKLVLLRAGIPRTAAASNGTVTPAESAARDATHAAGTCGHPAAAALHQAARTDSKAPQAGERGESAAGDASTSRYSVAYLCSQLQPEKAFLKKVLSRQWGARRGDAQCLLYTGVLVRSGSAWGIQLSHQKKTQVRSTGCTSLGQLLVAP